MIDSQPQLQSPSNDPTTKLIALLAGGDDTSVAVVWMRVHQRIRLMAAASLKRERFERLLDPTDVAHEVFLRLRFTEVQQAWSNRGHFFGSIARSISQILIDRARRRICLHRRGFRQRVPLASIIVDGDLSRISDDPEELECLRAVLEDFTARCPRQGEVAWLRFVIGLSTSQVAELLGVSTRTVESDWAFARSWLRAKLAER